MGEGERHLARKVSRAALTSSEWVHAMLCGPRSRVTTRTSSMKPGNRSAVALTGRIRSSAPWITRVGTSKLRRSARKSVSQVSTQACVAYADAPSAAMKPACQAWSLMRLPPKTSAL